MQYKNTKTAQSHTVKGAFQSAWSGASIDWGTTGTPATIKIRKGFKRVSEIVKRYESILYDDHLGMLVNWETRLVHSALEEVADGNSYLHSIDFSGNTMGRFMFPSGSGAISPLASWGTSTNKVTIIYESGGVLTLHIYEIDGTDLGTTTFGATLFLPIGASTRREHQDYDPSTGYIYFVSKDSATSPSSSYLTRVKNDGTGYENLLYLGTSGDPGSIYGDWRKGQLLVFHDGNGYLLNTDGTNVVSVASGIQTSSIRHTAISGGFWSTWPGQSYRNYLPKEASGYNVGVLSPVTFRPRAFL